MSAGHPSGSRVRDALLLGTVFIFATWFYAWAPASYPTRWSTREPSSYYAELADAYVHGTLYLQRAPAPELIALADPYDPAQNAPYRLNDLSYFRGRYYLYHGAAPAVVLLTPFHLITGKYLTDAAAVLIFCLAGAAFNFFTLAGLKTATSPRAPAIVLVCCAAALVFANGYYLVLRDAGLNQVPIAAAYCFVSVAIWALWQAGATLGAPWRWLLVASTAYAFAIASRPHYIFGGAAFLVPLVAFSRQDSIRRRWSNWIAVVAPLAIVVIALLAHNQLRFGQFLEFGQRYMLGGWDQRTLGFSGLRGVAENTWLYLFAPGTFSSLFPFVTAPSWLAVGVLVHVPFVWFALAARRSFAAILLVILAGNLGVLVLLPSGNEQAIRASANARYVFDFLPTFVLLACLGALQLTHDQSGTLWPRRLVIASTVLLTLISVGCSLSLDFQRYPPETYRRLAQLLDLPGALVQRWQGLSYGPIKLDIAFPVGKSGAYEPLVTTGTRDAGDLLYAHYDSQTTVRFGLVGTSIRGPLSPPVAVTYGQPHRLEIQMGSLYPEVGHPWLATLSNSALAHLKRTLHINLDGRTVYETPAHFFSSKPDQVRIGATDFLRDYCAAEFSGRILTSTRLPIAALVTDQEHTLPEYGPLRMVVRFPKSKSGGIEPLVVSGLQGAGDFAYVHYLDDQHISLGLDHWGHPGLSTDPLPVNYGVEHTLEIRMGALFPSLGHVLLAQIPPKKLTALKRHVSILLDGKVVLEAEQETYDCSPYDVFIGRNAIGGSTCSYEFTGAIIRSERLPPPAWFPSGSPVP